MKYTEIHLWELPKTQVFIRVKKELRTQLIHEFTALFGSESKAIAYLNDKSKEQNLGKKYSRGSFYSWIKGTKGTAQKSCNMPLWVLIEISKALSESLEEDNKLMIKVESNLEYYSSCGTNVRIYQPKMPILVTPELISLIFHFFGDGHISLKPSVTSSYRQMNSEGLMNFYHKLCNCFGYFPLSESSIKEGKIDVPKSITHLITEYFGIYKSDWHNAYVPKNIKKMPTTFLLAGLLAFIVDEGNVAEVIEIYSKNQVLINDIRDIAINCGYKCMPIRKKFRYGKFDSYRFLISAESYIKLYQDLKNLKREFPTCSLVHKMEIFDALIKRKTRKWIKREHGETKSEILGLCSYEKTISDLALAINIGNGSVREHLYSLEKQRKISRVGYSGRNILWKTIN